MKPPSPPPSQPPTTAAGPSTNRPAGTRLWLRRDDAAESGESFDALTDLFLGEVARPRREGEVGRGTEAGGGERERGRPALRLVVDEPATDAVKADAAAEAALEPGTVGPRATRGVAVRQPPFIETLVVGNLPVMASAWASQYVREIARASGKPVAFLRVQAGFVTVELVGEVGAGGGNGTGAPAARDLDEALAAAAEVTGRWVVRVDSADECEVAARRGVQLVTLLTATDEPARVNAYSAVKTLTERLGAAEAGSTGPMVRIAIMSAPEEEAEEAGRALVEAVKRFIGRDVQHAVCSSKIRSGRAARLVFNSGTELGAGQIIEKLEHMLGMAAVEERAARGAGAEVEAVEVVREDAATAEAGRGPESRDAAVTAVMSGVLEDAAAERGSEGRAGAVAARPEAAAAVAAGGSENRQSHVKIDDVALWAASSGAESRQAGDEPGELARFIAGAEATAIRCPYAEGVELSLGADGRLHLSARSSGPADDERTLAGLMVASAWAEAHAMLLKPSLPRMDPGAGPAVLHLFTTTPKATRRLLETSVRVHVLGAVRVGEGLGWYSAELN